MTHMSKLKNGKVITLLVIVLIIAALVVYNQFFNKGISNHADKYEGVDLSRSVSTAATDEAITYTQYLQNYSTDQKPSDKIDIDIYNYSKQSTGAEVLQNVYGESKVLQTSADSNVEWKVNVPDAGLYNIYIEYYPTESKSVDIERAVNINGEQPFKGADLLTFKRVWSDKGAVTTDNRGNQIRPTQVENPTWQSTYLKDASGYVIEPYEFHLKAGENTINLKGVNEPLAIRKLVVENKAKDVDYSTYASNIDKTKFKDGINFCQEFQGENSARRSSPSLYASYDRSSSNVVPYNAKATTLNMTGGVQYKVAGDWIEWDIEVPEDGQYVVGIDARQSYNRGLISNRSVYIDGQIPFKEVSQVGFKYNTAWDMKVLSDANGNAYKFAMTKGKHTIRLEVTLGDMGQYLSELSQSVKALNDIYRSILVLTGTTPDQFRDYKIDEVYPNVIKNMSMESKRLYKIVDEVAAYTGQKGSEISVAQTLASQLERFVENPDKIPKALQNFKDNVSSLGTSIQTLSQGAMDIDYIAVAGAKEQLPKVKESFVDKAVHETRCFIYSFIYDSKTLGSVYTGDNTLDVWILTGRDQSTILKNMIDDTFTPQSGIGVNVKLVDQMSLLPAVVAGTGPDIALTVPQGEPVNYALRGASVNLNQFADLKDVLSEYYEGSYEAYKFNGGMYGLPETMNYNVLFYRTDIMKQLGLDVPQTWDDLIKELPVLQKKSLEVGIPSLERKINNVINPDLANYFAQLYQRGGSVYNEDGSLTKINSEAGIKAFEFYTKLFTNYKLPKVYDFPTRFRSGQMPIGIADYSNYNTLAVFAPEIKGLWKFAMIPGTQKEDGTIDRATQAWGQCSMMLNKKDNSKYQTAWTFLKWWASSDTQLRFGRELESVMGSSARYATANRVTFGKLAWNKQESEILGKQAEEAFGIPEVAGSYYTPRHITNALRKVINSNTDPRETLNDYARTIQDELNNKRSEFGLPVADKK